MVSTATPVTICQCAVNICGAGGNDIPDIISWVPCCLQIVNCRSGRSSGQGIATHCTSNRIGLAGDRLVFPLFPVQIVADPAGSIRIGTGFLTGNIRSVPDRQQAVCLASSFAASGAIPVAGIRFVYSLCSAGKTTFGPRNKHDVVDTWQEAQVLGCVTHAVGVGLYLGTVDAAVAIVETTVVAAAHWIPKILP